MESRYQYDERYPILNAKEERVYLAKAQDGDRAAYDYLVLCNRGLVMKIATKHANAGISIEDLYQTGIMGLMRAIDKFDLKTTYKLSTYAYWWIQQTIIHEVQNKSRAIRVPYGVYQSNYDLIIQNSKLEQELGRRSTTEELAEYTGKTTKEIKKFASLIIDVCSLDESYEDNENSPIKAASILDKGSDISNDIISNMYAMGLLQVVENILTEKEYIVFIQHVGIGCIPKTFLEIARGINLTKQRTQQIFAKSLEKLNNNSQMRQYKLEYKIEVS